MRVQLHFALGLAALLLAVGSPAAQAARSYDNCSGFIDSLPAVITTQGTWCLRQHLATALTDGVAIELATNNVTLDCNDFKVGGLGAGPATQTIGVRADDRVNLIVRNCQVRGFRIGIFIAGVDVNGAVVEDNRLDGNTFVGIFLDGANSVIRRNLITDTGGAPEGIGWVAGIQTRSHFSKEVDVVDNTIDGVRGYDQGSDATEGLLLSAGGQVSGNRIRNVARANGNFATGISFSSSAAALFENNQISGIGDENGDWGIACGVNTGQARNNFIVGTGVAISGCVDAGGNLVVAE